MEEASLATPGTQTRGWRTQPQRVKQGGGDLSHGPGGKERRRGCLGWRLRSPPAPGQSGPAPLEAACAVQMEHLRLIPWSRAWALGTEPGLGTWHHRFLPVSAWTGYFTLHLSLSQFPCRDSNTYLTRPLEGWELSENAYKMLRTLSGI